MSNALHHHHKRKRIHQGHEPFPHPQPLKRFIDSAVYVIGVAAPIMTLPQVYKIYAFKDAAAISLLTFSANMIFNIFWLFYGFLHKEKPLMIMYAGWFAVNTTIVLGVLLYG